MLANFQKQFHQQSNYALNIKNTNMLHRGHVNFRKT